MLESEIRTPDCVLETQVLTGVGAEGREREPCREKDLGGAAVERQQVAVTAKVLG